jgi:hypothetical protein
MPNIDDIPETEPTAEEIEGWLTALAVASQFGKSTRWIGQMVRTGQLHPRTDSKGARRFDPDELEALLPNADTSAIQNQDGIMRILQAHAKDLAVSNLELLKILPGPMQQLLDNQAGLIAQLFARIRELETERQKMLAVHEQAMSAVHEREMNRYKTEREQARRDKALANFSEAVPKFFEQLFIGKDVSALIQSLDPTLLEALTSDDIPVLDAEQKARVKAIAAALKEREKEPKCNEPSQSK